MILKSCEKPLKTFFKTHNLNEFWETTDFAVVFENMLNKEKTNKLQNIN